MKTRIQAAARRLLGIEGQTWKHAVTSNSIMGMHVDMARIPTPPSEPGNWELVAVAARGFDVVFWWKAPDKPSRGPFHDSPIPVPLKDPDPDLVQYRP
jgi:hypothetical protein